MTVTYICDPEGEYVDLITEDQTITISTLEVERIYNTPRAAQLGADTGGFL